MYLKNIHSKPRCELVDLLFYQQLKHKNNGSSGSKLKRPDLNVFINTEDFTVVPWAISPLFLLITGWQTRPCCNVFGHRITISKRLSHCTVRLAGINGSAGICCWDNNTTRKLFYYTAKSQL